MEFTKRTGLSVFEASAKSGSGVESSFIALTDALIELAEKNAPAKIKQQSNGADNSFSSTSGGVSGSADNNPYYTDNPPFDDSRIKMKRI